MLLDKRIEILDFLSKRVKELSKGQKQKVMFLLSLLGDPSVFIYDEPFTGLDPINSEILKNIILEKKAEGKAIIFSTHILEQAEEITDRIIIINKGEVVEYGGVDEIKRKYSNKRFIIEFDGEKENLLFLGKILFLREGVAEVESELKFDEIVEKIKDKVKIKSIRESLPSLKEIYIKLIGENQ